MKFRIKFANQIVGIFILLAILGIAAALILLGANQRWFQKNYQFHTRFRSGSGLKVGMPITLKGFEIGKVGRVRLDPKTRVVTMNFYIYEEYYEHIVLENSVIELATSPIGIGGGLLFYPGKPTLPPRPPLAEGSYIPSLDFPEGMEIVRQGQVERETKDDSIGALLTNVGPILERVDTVLLSINDLVVSLDNAIEGDRQNQLGSVLDSTDTLLRDIDLIVTGRDRGPMGNILDNMSSATDALDESIEKITRDLTALAQDLRLITANVEEMTSLDEENPLFRDVNDILKRIKGIIEELQEFAGFISGTSPQITGILEEGRATLVKSQDVLEALKNNPLLSGGVPKEKEQPTPYKGYRDEEF
jgi:phospholipid/cholesterol/gamma-HCH transport system substrate-binding protein